MGRGKDSKMKQLNSLLLAWVIVLTAAPAALAHAGATITGRVTDARGDGVAGAAVTLYMRDDRMRLSTVTDAHGTYRFERLAAGDYFLEGDAPGFAHAAARVVRVE